MDMNYQEQITVSFIDELEKIGEAKTRVGRAAVAGMNKRRVAAQWQSARARTARHQPAGAASNPATPPIRDVPANAQMNKMHAAADKEREQRLATEASTTAAATKTQQAADAAKVVENKERHKNFAVGAGVLGGGALLGGAAYAAKKHRER